MLTPLERELLEACKSLLGLVGYRWDKNPGFEEANKRHNSILDSASAVIARAEALARHCPEEAK